MAHKTFISYKYTEAQDLRDAIIDALGDDAIYYQGETSDSPNLTDYKTETIREHLKDMIFDTSVTIVIVSPNMKESKWIDWEIEYSLREYARNGRYSRTNGIVAVIQKYNGGYDWFKRSVHNLDGHITVQYDTTKTYNIIANNRFNQIPLEYTCSRCRSVNEYTASYISFVDEETFLASPNEYIENAYNKSQNISNYSIVRTH